MTIAIGMNFQGGVLLATDTQYTHGHSLKTSGSKIVPWHFVKQDTSRDEAVCVFAIAGDVPMARSTINKIGSKISASDFYFSTIKTIVEEVLLAVFKKQIWPHPNYKYDNGPSFDLIIATWSMYDGLHLLTCSEHAVNEELSSECMGVGLTLGKYLLKPLYDNNRSESDCVLLARYVIKEVKSSVPGCGKETELYVVRENGSTPNIEAGFSADNQDDVVEAFWVNARSVMFEAANPDVSDEQMREGLKEFSDETISSRKFLGWKEMK